MTGLQIGQAVRVHSLNEFGPSFGGAQLFIRLAMYIDWPPCFCMQVRICGAVSASAKAEVGHLGYCVTVEIRVAYLIL